LKLKQLIERDPKGMRGAITVERIQLSVLADGGELLPDDYVFASEAPHLTTITLKITLAGAKKKGAGAGAVADASSATAPPRKKVADMTLTNTNPDAVVSKMQQFDKEIVLTFANTAGADEAQLKGFGRDGKTGRGIREMGKREGGSGRWENGKGRENGKWGIGVGPPARGLRTLRGRLRPPRELAGAAR
jgi:hypothetical protein